MAVLIGFPAATGGGPVVEGFRGEVLSGFVVPMGFVCPEATVEALLGFALYVSPVRAVYLTCRVRLVAETFCKV